MKLADIIETFISGDWGEETVAEDTPNSVFCIRGADIVPITNHCFNGIPQRFVCDKTIENKTLKAGDLIIEKSGGSPTQSTGRIIYVSEDMIKAKGNVVCSNFCTAFRVKAGWNPLYVYYFWQNVYNHGAFFNFEGKTSGIKNLQLDNALSAIDIEYLPLEKQNRIVASLASIDEKIKVNRQINDNLEAMAKQLYDYWFVQFDFPNEEGKPYKSSGGAMVWNEKLKHQIPEGWEVKQLRDIIETNRGISYNTSSISGGGVPMINLASFNVDGSYKDAGLKSYNGNYTQEKILKPFDLVLCNTQQTAIEFSKDIIGKAFLIPDIFDGDIVSSHHINTIKTEEVLKPYLAYLSNTYHFHKYATGCCSGTNILGLDYNSFSQYKLEIPPKYLLKEFHDFIIDIVKRKSLIIKENKLLTKQRNEFLPLLMNGQATVNYHLSDD